ncbi:histidine phosphatase family protein [uncultured Megasphaera sp.]|uniref:SixA phosphatase family protein n=1 Tax=uncultured Megasphaera sp. TaxID=165188 RepID=UPI0025F12F05|nr:histidine phosphatase family protein [uncultured Megasphaera sp.]
MYLCVMRHGKAQPFSLKKPDKLRELTDKGCWQAASMAQWASSWWPEGKTALWVSPYVRTCQTASYLEQELPIAQFHTHEALASGDLVAVYDQILSQEKSDVVCIVGHSPFLDRWVQAWTGTAVDFKTGSMALLDFDVHGGRIGSASLLFYVHPKALKFWEASRNK